MQKCETPTLKNLLWAIRLFRIYQPNGKWHVYPCDDMFIWRIAKALTRASRR